MGTVQDHLEPGQRPVDGRDQVVDVLTDGGGVGGDPADIAAERALPLLVEVLLDDLLDRVVELVAAPAEELDAVVGHRVVGGADHHAEVRAERLGHVGHAGRRQHAEAEDVDACRGEAGDHGVLEELPGDPGVAADHGERPVALELTPGGEHPGGSNGKVQGQLCGQLTVRQTPDPVRAEDARHQRLRNQRLLNCGALRAFLRPAFLRSMTRASRVSSPAFLSEGRLASVSIQLRQRATPRRRAPA